MDSTGEFIDVVAALLENEVAATHDGDLGPRMELWSRQEPLTLFGAALTARGWKEIEPAFGWLAGNFSGSHSLEYEVVAAEASGDLGYVAAIERSVVTVRGEVATYALRVTTVLRREDGAWKVVLRHGDAYDESSRDITAGLTARASRTG